MKFNAQSKVVVETTVNQASEETTVIAQSTMMELSREALAMISGGAEMVAIGESRMPPWPPKSIWK
jgi:hypothetical protein